MPLSRGYKPKTISRNIHEMVLAGHPRDQAVAAALRVAREARPKRAKGGRVHHGPIKSPVAGRTDHLPIHVPQGAYVLPADIISAMGEGNTDAGFKIASGVFGQPFYGDKSAHAGKPYGADDELYGQPMPERADGGEVPIVAAGGEFVIHPDSVLKQGRGSMDDGLRILDEFVKRYRAKTVQTLKALPGPRRD